MNKKKILVLAVIILALVYFRKTIYVGFFSLVWFLLPNTPKPSGWEVNPTISQSEYNQLPLVTNIYDTTKIESDTVTIDTLNLQ